MSVEQEQHADVFTEDEKEGLKNFFDLYARGEQTANLQEMIENLEQMEEFNSSIVIKLLRQLKKKNKSYSLLIRHFL